MSLTYTDMFCGAGGSSIGLTEAGLTLRTALNHWERAIETHAANFPHAEHLCEDVNKYDLRRLPRTDVLWASPICTELSPAGGRKRAAAQMDLLEELGDKVEKEGFERTRATFWDVLRAVEIHRYKVILVENVVEAADWVLFDVWLSGMTTLGYSYQFVCVSSAHVGDDTNPHAPQWRDRMYIVFNAKGVPAPKVTPRPLAWCSVCDEVVPAVQSWKNPKARKVGKYGTQYVYRCPNGTKCRHAIVEPFVRPAAAAIDWSNLGQRIGDRKRTAAKPEGLAPSTIRRIRAGLAQFGEPHMISVNHDGDGRHYLPGDRPLPSRTAKIGDGLVVPAIVGELRRNGGARPADDAPLQTLAASGNHHYMVVPPGAFTQKHHGGMEYPRIEHMTKPITEPLAAVVAKPNMSLVIPYRKGNAKTVDEPLHTVATRESAGLLQPAVEIEDCLFRMLQPREHLRAQRFPDTYVVKGNKSEQTMQAGNAVSSNVAHWLGAATLKALS